MSRWGHRGTRGTHEDARVRVASRRRRRRVESRRCDDATIHRATGQRKTRANDRISEKTRLRFFDWKKSDVYGMKKSLFSKKKMKISWVGIWCRVYREGRERRRGGDEETDGGGICPSICSRAFRARSVDRSIFFVCFARARTMASD